MVGCLLFILFAVPSLSLYMQQTVNPIINSLQQRQKQKSISVLCVPSSQLFTTKQQNQKSQHFFKVFIMSHTQKQMLLRLHKNLVNKQNYYAAQDILGYLTKNKIPKHKFNLSIVRFHLLGQFNYLLVNNHSPNN